MQDPFCWLKSPWLRRAPLALLALALLLGATWFGGTTAQAADGPRRLLVFSKTAGFRHASIADGLNAIQQLAATNHLVVEATEDAAAFNETNLARFHAVVFLMTTGDVLDPNQQAAFERYIRAGNGYAGVHSASDTEYSWPWYGGLVGAYFSNHPAIQTATVRVEDTNHVSSGFLPAAWVRNDEWYNFRSNPRGAVQVLARLDESTYTGGTMGDHPIAWYRGYDGGRAWYTAGGHTSASYTEPLFRAHLLGGLHYAAGVPEYLGPLRQFLHQRALKTNNGIEPHEPIDYRRQLVERWADVIAAAWSNRQPESLEVVIPRLEGVAFNRRYWMKDGSTGWIPRKGDTNIFRPAGPVDTDFPFLLARRVGQASSLTVHGASVPRVPGGRMPPEPADKMSAPQSDALGSLAVFAMHTAVYDGPSFGADFPGHLQTNLTAAFGPKFVSIFGEGCAGDVNRLNPFNPGTAIWSLGFAGGHDAAKALEAVRARDTLDVVSRADAVIARRMASGHDVGFAESRINTGPAASEARGALHRVALVL